MTDSVGNAAAGGAVFGLGMMLWIFICYIPCFCCCAVILYMLKQHSKIKREKAEIALLQQNYIANQKPSPKKCSNHLRL
uniref:Candidate secreted effector n=1 Tax=Meloidogyne incognita TaxID=6306 RepID=A0A914MDY3_MELIC